MIPNRFLLQSVALCAAATAQGPDFLLTYSQVETTLSGSNGTSLAVLNPNEIAHLEYSNGPCSNLSAEKWAPRACFHAMAGDEDTTALYWNPAIFGSIDALLEGMPTSPVAGVNPRTVFWSPGVAMGNGVSGANQLRPGDVGRIVRTSAGDGQVEFFITQEQIDNALGLALTTPIDVDAAEWVPGTGIFLSLDADYTVLTPCGPVLMQDGAVFVIEDSTITWTPDFRVAATTAGSAVVVYSEAQMDAFVLNAGVTDRTGACVTQAVDVESLAVDWSGTGNGIPLCAGLALWVPDFLFSVETGTGASVLTTSGAGQIYNHLCTSMGRPCGGGPTFGPQTGIQATSSTLGAPSWVNSLLGTWTLRYSMEARIPVLNSSPNGLPAGATLFDVNSPAPLNMVVVTFVPAGFNAVPTSAPAFPFSLAGFPDYYPLPTPYMPALTVNGTGTFPSFAIPPNFPVKILFQAIGIVNGQVELSTPAILDIT